MARQRKTLEEIEVKLTGGEPNFKGKEISNVEMAQALNWYSQNRDNKTAIKYTNEYFKRQKIKIDLSVINKQKPTFGFLCRLKTVGAIFTKKHEDTFQAFMSEMENEVVVLVKDVPIVTNVISIQDRIAEKVSEIVGELEGSIDDYILSGFVKFQSPYGLMHSRIKGAHALKISEVFKHRRQEFAEPIDSKDTDLKEGYSNFTKTQLKKLVAFCDLIILDCNKISGEAKNSRKPRKRKVKSIDQLTSKVLYCESNDEFKLKSELPKTIIGATQLWVFNVKTRKLGVYHALDAEGFSIKGTSMLNYSETKSVQKTLRKPEVILPEIIKGSKVFLRNVIDSVKAKESCLNGRLNRDTILLKVIK